MTKSKKAIFGMLSMLLVAAVAVAGVVMWLTDDTEKITNTFTVGNIDIALEETWNTDTDGVDGNDAWTLQMVPGVETEKDPVVTVEANSEDCYLFVKVDKSDELDTYLDYAIDTGIWTELEAGVYYREVAKSSDDQPFHVLVNDKVKVKDSVTKKLMDELVADGGQLTLEFQAFAVQKSGFATADAAWEEAEKLIA